MGMDSGDYDLVTEIKRLNNNMLEELQRSRRANEGILDRQTRLLDVFNKMADGLDKLAAEIRALREDLGPKTLDKTRNSSPLKEKRE